MQEPEGVEDKEARPSKHNRTTAHKNSQRLRQHAQGQHRSAPARNLELKGDVDTSSIPNPDTTANL